MPASTRHRSTPQPSAAQSARSKSQQATPQATRKSTRTQSKGPQEASPEATTSKRSPARGKKQSNNPAGRPRKQQKDLEIVQEEEEEEEPVRVKPKKGQSAKPVPPAGDVQQPGKEFRPLKPAEVRSAARIFNASYGGSSGHDLDQKQPEVPAQAQENNEMDIDRQHSNVGGHGDDGPAGVEEEAGVVVGQGNDHQTTVNEAQHNEEEHEQQDAGSQLGGREKTAAKGKMPLGNQEGDASYHPTPQNSSQAPQSSEGFVSGNIMTPFATSHTAPSQELERRRELIKADMQLQVAPQYPKKSFIDPQLMATTIAFDDQSQQQRQNDSTAERIGAMSQPHMSSAPFSGNARQAYDVDEQDQQNDPDPTASQDVGFDAHQANEHTVGERRSNAKALQANAKRRAPGDNDASPTKRQRTMEAPTGESQLEAIGQQSQREESSHRYKEAHQISLGVSRVKPYVPQVRKAWTFDEVEAFLEGIAKCGPKYSQIKEWDRSKNGHKLEARTQVNLKDKARNMKLDYLKSGVELPPNFEGIPLDKKALQKLEELGVPYTQGRIRNVAH